MESRKLIIFGVTYDIQKVEVVNKFNPAHGEIDFINCIIKIDKNLPTDLKNQTLLHECLHGIFDLLGYYEDSENEQKVQSIATALHLLFKSPDFTFYK